MTLNDTYSSMKKPYGMDIIPPVKEKTNDFDNNPNIEELKQLQAQFDNLLSQYNEKQQTMTNNSLETINRTSSSNPYLGKNALLTGSGTIGYVTQMGNYKSYENTDMLNNTAGKNGCPVQGEVNNIDTLSTDFYTTGDTINSTPSLLMGTPMISGQSCGNEGQNVYVSSLVNNPSSTYVGCYNDKPASTQMNIVPVMNSTNNVNGFVSSASSVYYNNNDFAGPWCGFDQNVNTYWHSNVESSSTMYDGNTGAYIGDQNIGVFLTNVDGMQFIKGEWLQINLPLNSTSALTSYEIQGRQDCCGTPNARDPNTWYVFGWNSAIWVEVDYQENQEFNYQSKTYTISNPQAYSSYIIIVTVCGSSGDKSGNRTCVQIATWNLFTSSDYSFTDSQRSMIWNPSAIGYTSLENCQKYASDNGYQYFGMQDVQSDGTAACLVSNDLTKSQSYGDASKITSGMPIWSSNTSGNNNSYITTAGSYCVNDAATGGIIWETDNKPGECFLGGLVNLYSISGSYGGNCVGKPVGIDCGNPSSTESYGTTGIVGNLNSQLNNVAQQNLYSGTSNFTYAPLSEFTGEDPAFCCAKMVDYTYQCGGNAFKTGSVSGGTNINFDCSAEVSKCKFFLILQDDGNMCLYRGTSPNDNQGAIWCSQTNGKQRDPNPDWAATKGKTGLNYLTLGQGLNSGEWIGSNDGSLMLIMQTDGNLVLYTSTTIAGCKKGSDGNQYGGGWVNAIYKLNETGNVSSLGKIGYVDADTNLHEYPSSMLQKSNDYQLFNDFDSGGNDLGGVVVPDLNGCISTCNSNNDCAGFVWQPGPNVCYPKNSNMFPTGPRNSYPGLTLGVRKPILNSSTMSSSCSPNIVDIDSIRYDNYIKSDPMTADKTCNSSTVNTGDIDSYNDITSQLATLGQEIASKMEYMYQTDNNLLDEMKTNTQQFNEDILTYKNIGKKIKKELSTSSNNNIEGMANLKMQDINGMLSDTDLRVLQENYSYIFWSILAVGLLTITVNNFKK